MEETTGRNVNVSVGDFNLCVLGVLYILTGFESQGYMFSLLLLSEKFLIFQST